MTRATIYAPWGDELGSVGTAPGEEQHIGEILAHYRYEQQELLESAEQYLIRQGHPEAGRLLTQFFKH